MHSIVQLFNWKFIKIETFIPQLAEIGISHIHVSPPTLSIDSEHWWGRYQPLHYFIIAGPLGYKEDFKSMCNQATKYNISIMIDAVINHMAEPVGNFNQLVYGSKSLLLKHPLWLHFSDQYLALPPERNVVLREEHFFSQKEQFNISNYEDHEQLIYGNLGGLPDLDLYHQDVQSIQKEYLKFLVENGVTSIRIDAVKHIQPTYVSMITETFLELVKYQPQALILSEIICGSYNYDERLKPYVDTVLNDTNWKHVKFYNFPLLENFKNMCNNKISIDKFLENYTDGIPVFHAVQFGCNHDIPYNNAFEYLELNSNEAFQADILMTLAGHGIPYYFVDDDKSINLQNFEDNYSTKNDFYSIDTFKDRKLKELLTLYQDCSTLRPMKTLWSNDHNFWIGYRVHQRSEMIDNTLMIIFNNSKYNYDIHSCWPAISVFNNIPNGSYLDYFNGEYQINIKNGRLLEQLTLPPKTIVVLKINNISDKDNMKSMLYQSKRILNKTSSEVNSILQTMNNNLTHEINNICKIISI